GPGVGALTGRGERRRAGAESCCGGGVREPAPAPPFWGPAGGGGGLACNAPRAGAKGVCHPRAAPRGERRVGRRRGRGPRPLARNHVVAGVCETGPATDFVGNQPAAWWSSHATPTARYTGFCHTQDQLSAKIAAWHAVGVDAYGAVRDIAGVQPPYGLVHELST